MTMLQLPLLCVAIITSLLLIDSVESYSTSDLGDGIIYRLSVTQDVSLERGTTNYNYLEYLIVGTHINFPLKRSLLQFEDLPDACVFSKIRWAKMYVYFVYSHKASFQTVQEAPYITRPLQLHQVNKAWSESQATSLYRMGSSTPWSAQYLALDGSDAEPNGVLCEPVHICTSRPAGFIEFNVTRAVLNWNSVNPDPNHGLLLLATNENVLGRDTRFYSNRVKDRSLHAYINVMCDY